MLDGFSIAVVNAREASHDDYAAMHHFTNLMRAERMPDDPPTPLRDYLDNYQNVPPEVDVRKWLVRHGNGGDVVALGTLGIGHFSHNTHTAQADIDVLATFRQRGIARHLLGEIAPVARQEQRTLILTNTAGNIPAGANFLERIGAQKALERQLNQLDVSTLDRRILSEWIAAFEPATGEFSISVNQGPYPEQDLAAITALFNDAYNSMPRGDLKIAAYSFTPEQLRQFEKSMFVGGRERWTVFARHRATNAFAGLTEVTWRPSRPTLLAQGATAVLPEFQRNGIGRMVKATMLETILAQHPEIRFVRTDNANVNAAMLAINDALGFKLYQTETSWQIETDKIFDYLARAASHEAGNRAIGSVVRRRQ